MEINGKIVSELFAHYYFDSSEGTVHIYDYIMDDGTLERFTRVIGHDGIVVSEYWAD